jgi:hypothetical protein
MESKCFVLMPFSEPFNVYYKDIIVPAIVAAGFRPMRADEIYGTRAIIEDIFREIKDSALLIADVTGKNPNVNYELGIAHTLGRPVVIISQFIEDIPFDYRHLRAIIYDTSQVNWAVELKLKITKSLQSIQLNVEVLFESSDLSKSDLGFTRIQKDYNKISVSPQVFVVMKFGDKRLDSAYELVVKPVIKEFNLGLTQEPF